MKVKDLLLLAILLVLVFGFLFVVVLPPIYPSFGLYSSSWPHHDRYGPGGGIQRGANIDLPSHSVPWLGPNGGIQTGGTIHTPSHPVPWIGGNGGQHTGNVLNLPAHPL